MTSETQINSPLQKAADWIERHPWIVASIFALLLAIQITPKFKMSPDGVSYMSIARSLMLHGHLARVGSPHLRYAPAYPFFISPAFIFTAHQFIAVQFLQWIYALVLFAGIYIWSARYIGRSAIWIAALALASAGYWDLFRTASSEIVFAPCLIWSGVFLAKSLSAPKPFASIFVAIFLGALACATRQAGAMLVPGFILAAAALALRRRIPFPRAWKLSVTFTVCIATVSFALIAFDHWGARQVTTHDTGYTAIFFQPGRSLPGQIAEGIRRQTAEIGRLLIPGMWKTHSKEHDFFNINNWIYLAACIPIAIGWWKFSRDTADPLALMLPFYIALCIVYPYDSGTRFSVPIFPIIAASLWYFLKPLAEKRAAIFLIFTAIHTLVSLGFWLDDAAHVRRRYQRWPEIQSVAAVVPPDANVIALRGEIDDRWLFLMWLTDRPVAPENFSDPVAPAADWIVTSSTEATSPGFRPFALVGDYQLEHRTSPPSPLRQSKVKPRISRMNHG